MLLKSRGKTVSTSFHAVFKYVPVNASNSQQKSDQLLAKNGSTYVNSSPSKHQMASALDPVDAKRQRMAMNSAETAITTQQIAANGNSSDNDSESGSNDDSTADDFGSAGGDDEETVQMDTSMLEALNNYIALRRSSSVQLTQSQMSSIRLLLRLRNTKASLNTYDSVMTWHLEDTGKKRVDETLGQCKDFISRHKVYKALNSRYSFSQDCGYELHSVKLPHSNTSVDIVRYNAKAAIMSLLTDPRLCDDDYLFFDDNPLQPPPKDITEIRDLNTGEAYTETYKRLINDPSKEMLLPVVFYIDAASTGQFVQMPVTALKLTLGIFNRKARDKPYLWRTLGYVPKVVPRNSRGKRMLAESNHAESALELANMLDDDGVAPDNSVVKAQDSHTMLAALLESYVELQGTGFEWDLCYNGKVFRVRFVMFTPFMKVDTEEADALCGKYQTRTGNVANLCRYCTCPTAESDLINAKHSAKTQDKIADLIGRRSLDRLKQMSQHDIDNAFYKIRFGLHNKQSIHGACPMEMLHAMLLGVFKRVREGFFAKVGKDSDLAHSIDSLASIIGSGLKRQSVRDLPRTQFSKGLNEAGPFNG